MLIRLYFFYLTTISTIMATQKTPLPYDGTLALRRERKTAYPMIYLLFVSAKTSYGSWASRVSVTKLS